MRYRKEVFRGYGLPLTSFSLRKLDFNKHISYLEWDENWWPGCGKEFPYRYRSILIRSNKMQQYAGIYLLQHHSTCFEGPSHPLSGVHKTITAAAGTGHSIWATTFLQRGQWPRRRKVVSMLLLRPVTKGAVTVLFTPNDGCDGHPKHVEWYCSK